MFDAVKKAILKILKINYWRKGKCNQCGQCCRTITLRYPDKLLTTEAEFEQLKKVLPRFEQFHLSDRADNGVLLFTCEFLKDNKCSLYHLRSLYCRFYPHFSNKFIKMGGKPLASCGFYYEPVVTFTEVFEKTVFQNIS